MIDMLEDQFYIYKKEVDWSALREGFSIPVSTQIVFQEKIKSYIKRGEKRDINIILDNHTYQVKLINQIFDEAKYPGHSDIVQIRYSPQSPFVIKLREIFKTSMDYLKEKRISNRVTKLPRERREYIVLYTTQHENTFFLDHITNSDSNQIRKVISGMREEDFEFESNYKKIDDSARIEAKQQVIKIRRLDKAVGESLKLFYNYKCQICGVNFSERHNCYIVEAHHIESFVSTMNNNANNIIVLCPCHHRIMHKANPIFDKRKFIFTYPNGFEENLILNKHL
ncbi:MAG: HNH endonuclease [Nitrospirae bacterium]|nr:HNH endonuclease [Nitrospirota bacterium]